MKYPLRILLSILLFTSCAQQTDSYNNAIIRPTKASSLTLYLGIPNPVEIYINEDNYDELILESDKKIKQRRYSNKKNMCAIQVYDIGNINIVVKTRTENDTTTWGKQKFIVKKLKKPTVTMNNKTGIFEMNKDSLLAIKKINLVNNSDFNQKSRIISYKYESNNGIMHISETDDEYSTNGTITKAIKDDITTLSINDNIIFSDIKIMMIDGNSSVCDDKLEITLVSD